jgi:hypothetical protein
MLASLVYMHRGRKLVTFRCLHDGAVYVAVQLFDNSATVQKGVIEFAFGADDK